MNTTLIGLFAAFWAMQVAASMLFKIGSGAAGRWIPCFPDNADQIIYAT